MGCPAQKKLQCAGVVLQGRKPFCQAPAGAAGMLAILVGKPGHQGKPAGREGQQTVKCQNDPPILRPCCGGPAVVLCLYYSRECAFQQYRGGTQSPVQKTGGRANAPPPVYCHRGNCTVNVAPPPGVSLTRSAAPCSRASSCATASPSPQCCLSVRLGSAR